MEQHELIRRMVFVDGLSQRQVAKRLGHSRKTVAKALQTAAPTGYQRAESRKRPKLDPFVPIIRQWLIEDSQRRRKQRHTAVRIFERLRDEHGFPGTRRAVSDVVREIRAEFNAPEVFVPIDHPPGQEVQIDWGEADVILNGETTRIMLFCARLPYSKATFVRAYARDDQPSFLDAHVHLIGYLGGVPAIFAYDNLKSAVTKIIGRERSLSKKFQELRSHYLFDTRFCNVARGNEKGHTENAVKRMQRTYMTPLPSVCSLEQLNEHLLACCKADLSRPDDSAGKSYGELLEMERSKMSVVPPEPFAACINRAARVDAHATVQFEGCRYSVPCKYACLHALVRVWIEQVEVIIGNEIVATHRRAADDQWMLQMEHYLPILQRKPGLLDSGKPFTKTQFSDAERLMRSELEYRYGADGTRQFLNILMLGKENDFSLVRRAIANCAASRAFHEEAVRLEMQRLTTAPQQPNQSELDLSDRPQLQSVAAGQRDLSIYDSLLSTSHDPEDSVPLSTSMQRSANDANPCPSSLGQDGEITESILSQDSTEDATDAGERPEATSTPHVLGGVFFALCGMFS